LDRHAHTQKVQFTQHIIRRELFPNALIQFLERLRRDMGLARNLLIVEVTHLTSPLYFWRSQDFQCREAQRRIDIVDARTPSAIDEVPKVPGQQDVLSRQDSGSNV
jgi:hypothetical protein